LTQIHEINRGSGDILPVCMLIITSIIIAVVATQAYQSVTQFSDGTMFFIAICIVLTGILAAGLSPLVFRLNARQGFTVLVILAVLPVIVLGSHAVGSDELPLGTWIALICFLITEIVLVALVWPLFRSLIPVARPVWPLAGVAICVAILLSAGNLTVTMLESIAKGNLLTGLVLSALFSGYLLFLVIAVFLGISGFFLFVNHSDNLKEPEHEN
jgi:hypothetical protein